MVIEYIVFNDRQRTKIPCSCPDTTNPAVINSFVITRAKTCQNWINRLILMHGWSCWCSNSVGWTSFTSKKICDVNLVNSNWNHRSSCFSTETGLKLSLYWGLKMGAQLKGDINWLDSSSYSFTSAWNPQSVTVYTQGWTRCHINWHSHRTATSSDGGVRLTRPSTQSTESWEGHRQSSTKHASA